MQYLLDTNAWIMYLKDPDSEVRNMFSTPRDSTAIDDFWSVSDKEKRLQISNDVRGGPIVGIASMIRTA